MCSRAEGRPNVVIEALAAGLPVISADLPGVRGLVDDGQNGWLFETGNATALAKTLARVLASPQERLAMAARAAGARQMIPEWPTAALCHASLFERALREFGGQA